MLDLRIQKTYNTLIDAFLKLIQTKSLKSISIQELCDKALVRRSTFYHHFKNKDSFIRFLTDHFVKQIFPDDFIQKVLSKNNHHNDVNSAFQYEDTYRQYVEFIFKYIDKNYQMLESMISSKTLPVIIDAFSNNLVLFYKKYLKARSNQKNDLGNINPNLMAHYISGGMIATLKWSFRNNQTDNTNRKIIINQLAHIMYKLLN